VRPQSTWPQQIATTLVCVLLAAGCSPQTKEHLLRVFFTGAGTTNRPPVTASAAVSTNAAVQPSIPTTPQVVSSHKAFTERNCTACHLTAMSQELRSSGSDLCLECHDKLIGNAKYVHAPVNDGRCDLCHQPHESTERFLLTRKAQDLCLDCHPFAQMVKLRGHATMGTAECVSCHDPHRSEQKNLVKAQP
jgi:predicted CXXCH cytochrome family protein